jgi:DNA-binding PadR family transcriptional regulator
MLQQFFRGFVRIHILHHAEEGAVYGQQMADELARHGYENISPGTLYPNLHALEQAGYLRAERRLVEGRWRKYYSLTPSGHRILTHIRAQLRELADEVLVGARHAPA